MGTIAGAPHDYSQIDGSGLCSNQNRGDRTFFGLAGYDPFPQWTETDVSTKPPAWTGRDEELAQVKGANLNRMSLRYVQAYGTFLARAHLCGPICFMLPR